SLFIPIGGIYGEVGVNTFRNAIGAHYLSHSREYVAPLSIDIVRPWFETIGYGETVLAKETLKKSLLPPSLANGINIDYASIFWEDIIIKLKKRHKEKVVPYTRFLSLLMMHNQPKEPPFIDHKLAICTLAKPVIFKAPKPSSNDERVPQGTTLGAKPGHKKHSTSLKQPPESSSETTKGGSSKAPTGSKTGHFKRKKESSSAMDFNPSQTSASTLVVAKMHKEDQQATGNDALAVSTTEVDLGKSAPNDFVPHQKGPDERSKNYTPDHTFAWTNPNLLVDKTKSTGDGSQTAHPISVTKVDTRLAFIDDENQDDEPFITLDKSSEENAKRNKDTHAEHKNKQKAAAEIATLKAQFVFLNINQFTEHLVSSMKPEFSKLLSSHDFSSSIPTELKELPTKIIALSGEVNELKKHIKEFEIELPEFFNEISQKL
nr:hypothetical protein [Tanacetum cinerariifolium]